MKEILVWILILLTLPAMIELILVSFGALFFRTKKISSLAKGPLAIIVPAHDEEKHIESTLRSILCCHDPENNSDIVVVADNCSDNTALIAASLGVRVLVRTEENLRGKNWALRFAFDTLKDFDYFLVVDADTCVESNLIEEVRKEFGAGAHAVQVSYTVRNDLDSPRGALMNLALTAFNGVRPKGRAAWGLSAGIFGNGFALSAKTLQKVPYQANSIVEDLEYHLQLVREGLRVSFSSASAVYGLIPPTSKAAMGQRARWEGGRLSVFKQNIGLILKMILQGRWRLIEPLLDLVTWPLAFLLMIAIVGVLLTGGGYFLALLVVLLFHGLVTYSQMRVKPPLRTLCYVPLYCVWKLGLLARIWRFSKKGASWVRTERGVRDEF